MSEIENLKIGNGGTLHIVGNEDIIANEWEAGQVYIENRSYVIREHKLLMCNTTHTSVEPFDPDKWTEKNIGEALGTAGSANMIECTLAEYTAWKAGGQLINETVYVITDAPNLNATAKQISYDGGTATVYDVLTITDITSNYITMASGYTFSSGKVYKQGKHIFGNIVISGTLQGGNNVDTVGKINNPYRTAVAVNGFCGTSNGAWFTNNIGYIYVSAGGDLQVATTPTGMSYAKIHLDYVTA